jgi:hypothetical protein
MIRTQEALEQRAAEVEVERVRAAALGHSDCLERYRGVAECTDPLAVKARGGLREEKSFEPCIDLKAPP